MPGLVERAGNGREGQGSITAFYTVLTEGDDLQDPIADAARGILDGHIVLSRAIADAGLYPAIDVEASISRVMQDVVTEGHQQQARALRALFAAYQPNRDLIHIGDRKSVVSGKSVSVSVDRGGRRSIKKKKQ